MPRRCTVGTHPDRAEIDVEIAVGSPAYRNIAERCGLSVAAVGRHATTHLTLHLARSEDARDPAAAAALLERLGYYKAALSKLFDAAVARDDARAAVSLAARLHAGIELLGRVADSFPAPAPAVACAPAFVWPDGYARAAVPLETPGELAEHDGYTTGHEAEGEAPGAPVAATTPPPPRLDDPAW